MSLEIDHLRNLSPDHLLVKEGVPYIELDLKTCLVEVGITTEGFNGGKPQDGKIRYELSHRIDASGIYDWINREMWFDFEDLIKIGDEVSDLGRSIVRICKHYVPQLSFLAGYWSAEKWLNRPENCLDEYDISAETAYFDLMRIADKIIDEAASLYAILEVAEVQDFLIKYQEEMVPVTQNIDLSQLENMPADALLSKTSSAYLSIDLDSGEISAQLSYKEGLNVRNFALDAKVDASSLKGFCEGPLELSLKVLFEGRVRNFDGREMNIYLTRESESICTEITKLCIHNLPILSEQAGYWDAHDWLDAYGNDLEIPDGLTDEQACELASDMVGLARLKYAYIDEEELAVALLEKVEGSL